MELIGRHINIDNDFIGTPEYAKKIGCSIFQIFLGPPHLSMYKMRESNALVSFGNALKLHSIKVVIHGNYTINLAHPAGSYKGNMSINNAIKELTATYNVGSQCIGLIIHVGKNIKDNNLAKEDAMNHFIENINVILSKTHESTTLIVETGSSRGTEICTSIEDLSHLYNHVHQKHRLFFCVDTCHIWATGYDISTKKGANDYMDTFDKLIGLNKIKCIHFNNSHDQCGSKKDHHDDLMSGMINQEGIGEMARIAVKRGIYLIMETPLTSYDPKTNKPITFTDELAFIKKLIT